MGNADVKHVDTLTVRRFVNTHRSILYGMMLGDASINPRGKKAMMELGHSEAQKEYVFYKYDLLKPMVRAAPKMIMSSVNGKEWPTWRFRTSGDVEWQKLWSIFHENCRVEHYSNGTRKLYKTVNQRILDQLDDHGMAIWFMDDGSSSHKYRKDKLKVVNHNVKLCTHGYTEEENKLISGWLDLRYGISSVVYKDKNYLKDGTLRVYFNIYFRWKDWRDKMAPRLEQYFVPSLRHKLGSPQDKGRLEAESMIRSEPAGNSGSHLEIGDRQNLGSGQLK